MDKFWVMKPVTMGTRKAKTVVREIARPLKDGWRCPQAGMDCIRVCTIENQTYDEGSPNPNNECQICSPLEQGNAWSNVSDTTPCTDDDLCTQNEHCQEGECQGDVPDCSDEVSCTVDRCIPETGECEHTASDEACADSNPCVAAFCDSSSDCQRSTLADWTVCNPEQTAACFDGWCEDLVGGDTCESALNLTLNQETAGNFLGSHLFLDASTACDSSGITGPDLFYTLTLEPGRYVISAVPDEGVNIALALYSGCGETSLVF